MRHRLAALTVVPLLLLGVAACGEDDPSAGTDQASDQASDQAGDEPIAGVEVSGEFGQEPQVEIEPPLEVTESQTQVIETGEGGPVVQGEQALLHLVLYNGTSGERAAATYDQGQPTAITLSQEEIFPSIVEALDGVPAGSRIAVAAVPEDAFGTAGNPQLQIGPEDPVLFVVDVLAAQPTDVLEEPEGEAADLPEDIPVVEEEGGNVTMLDFSGTPKQPSDKLQVITLIEGTGPPARDESLVTFDYFGQVYDTDMVFDESFSKEPVTFPLGVGGLIAGWDEGLVDVKEGSRVMLIVPPDLGYGEQGQPPDIPGNATLTFVIDILGVD